MLVILTPRLEKIHKIDGDIINLYIIPKVIKDERDIKDMLNAEFNSCHKDIIHLTPLLVGNYNVGHQQLYNIIQSDIIISQSFETIIIGHFSYKDVNLESCINLPKDISMRLRFVLKKYEMNNMIGWSREINKFLINRNGFCKLRPIDTILED